MTDNEEGRVTRRLIDGGIMAIAIDRPHKRNGFTPKMLLELAQAYTAADDDASVRVILLHAEGGHFTAGLDLKYMAERQKKGELLFPSPDLVDPVGLSGRVRSKPLVAAVEGVCFTIGIELILAGDITVAADNARFAQLEVKRAIMAYGGATIRMVERAGWGNAMKLLLTGDDFDAATARDYGFVQEVVPAGQSFDAALAIAKRIADAAPLAVQATLANARKAVTEGFGPAAQMLGAEVTRMAASEDAIEGVASFTEKRAPHYRGR